MRTGTSTVVSCRLPDDVAAAFAAVAAEHQLSTSRLLRALVADMLSDSDAQHFVGVSSLTSSTSSAAAAAAVVVNIAEPIAA